MDKTETLDMIIHILLIGGMLTVGILIINFLITVGKKAKKDDPHALGLPQGSVRALLSISLIVFFILIALFFYFDKADVKSKSELAESILTILGTLVIAVSSFYFGIKATEQGSKITKDTFKDLSELTKQENQNISSAIILEAIAQNKELWKQQYQCEDVKLGKKKSANTQFDINCIQFIVKSKSLQVDEQNTIPPFIEYSADANSYNIPTDVVAITSSESESSQDQAVSLNLVDEALIENKEVWMSTYNVEDIIAALKVRGGQRHKVPCIQFIVGDKSNQGDTQTIPEHVVYQNYKIPTDVVEKDEASLDTSDVQVGDSVWRNGTTAKGTLGIKVYRDNVDGSKTDFLLSCYHVFCSNELKNGTKKYAQSAANDSIVADINGTTTEIAKVVEGEMNPRLDAALSKINSNISVDNHLKGFIGMPKYGIRLITNQEVLDEITVFTYGAKTKKAISGTVISRVANPDITVNGKKVRFENIIPVTKISVKGDSGAMAVDDKGKIIGIIFASDSTTSYIIPVLEIIIHFKIKIYYA
jgi:hypothetical protein